METIAVRLHPGADLKQEIERIATEHNIEAGVILSGVGNLAKTTIRKFVIGEPQLMHPANVEIVALSGTVSKNGCHIHLAVSDVDGTTLGGHLKEGCIVHTTCELVIGILPGLQFSRKPDEQTGWDELEIRS